MKFKKIVKWSRDIGLMVIIVLVMSAWQGRNLLDSDGSIGIDEQTFVSIDGQRYQLDKTDKKTVIYFFAPWCSICRFSINNLNILNDDEYRVIRVALDYSSKEEVESFIERNNVQGEVLLGLQDHKAIFNISGYPTYYVLDESLNVIANDMGYSTALGIKYRASF